MFSKKGESGLLVKQVDKLIPGLKGLTTHDPPGSGLVLQKIIIKPLQPSFPYHDSEDNRGLSSPCCVYYRIEDIPGKAYISVNRA